MLLIVKVKDDSINRSSPVIILILPTALVYELLYESVYQLPDVAYAVERMLHDPEGKTMNYELVESTNQLIEKAVTTDGREYIFDSGVNSACVLDDHKLCHFHNKQGFEAQVECKKKNDMLNEDNNLSTNYHFNNSMRKTDSLLYDDKKSCVRQLLEQGITPFPYRVAKALDPTIYRNIEFDSWSEMRKEIRARSWYYGTNSLQIGVRCLVKLRGSQINLYTGYIQDMEPNDGKCIVYVEELCEKHTVPFAFLQPLPNRDMKPWLQHFYKYNDRKYDYMPDKYFNGES